MTKIFVSIVDEKLRFDTFSCFSKVKSEKQKFIIEYVFTSEKAKEIYEFLYGKVPKRYKLVCDGIFSTLNT